MKIILGLDPAIGNTGWGIIKSEGNKIHFIASGKIVTKSSDELPKRLSLIYHELQKILEIYRPHSASLEEVFVNKNPASSLKLAHARGSVMTCVTNFGVDLSEYAPNFVKKAIVGVGRAEKDQVYQMVRVLLPGAVINGYDESDALAIAICHAHHMNSPLYKK